MRARRAWGIAAAALFLAPALGAHLAAGDAMRTYLASLDPARAGASAVWDGDRAFVFGGESPGFLDEIARFDPIAVSLGAATSKLPTARGGTAAVMAGAFAYVLGGEDATGALDDVVRFDTNADTIATLAPSLPSPRRDASAVWTGSQALLFGGRSGATRLDEIVAFDPATGAVATKAAKLPTPRAGTSAAWDGQYAYVFGGVDASGTLGEIVRYDPIADAISVMGATLSPPLQRASAVWDGANAFVIGGADGSARYREIVKYDPVADATTVMSAKLPTARDGTSAAWDGATALVFGGQTGASSFAGSVLSYSLAPGAPQGLAGERGPGAGEITLTWQPPHANTYSTFTEYRVIRAPPGEPFTLRATVPSTTLSFTDTGLAAGSEWEYRVLARDPVRGEGPPSAIVAVVAPEPPSAPRDFEAARGAAVGEIALSWTEPAENGGLAITGYRVWRGASSGALSLHAELGVATSFVDAGLPQSATYYYQVSAVNPAGEGPRSPEASATTHGPPTAPRNLAATGGPGAGEITIEWDPPADDGGFAITSYRVWRGTASGGETFLLDVGAALAYTDAGIPAGETRWYQVSAVNALGEGPRSAEASASAPVPPSEPRNLEASVGGALGEIALAWDPPLDDGGAALTGYVVWRGEESGGEVPIATIPPATSWTDEDRPLGARWHYRVSAMNGAGEGPLSNEAWMIGTGVDLPAPVEGATRAVVIALTPSPTAMVAGSAVRVSLVDALGAPDAFPRANVTVAVFRLEDAAAWTQPGARLAAALWSASVTDADLSATNGAATFTYPGLGGGAKPALLWARYERPGGASHEAFYAVGKPVLANLRAPGQPAIASAATPVFAN